MGWVQSAGAAKKVLVFPVVPLDAEQIAPELGNEMTQVIVDELKLNSQLRPLLGTFPKRAKAKRDSGRSALRSATEYKRALRKLAEGERHSKRLRFPKAISALSAAIKLLNRNIEHVEDYDRFLEAHMLLAVAYLRRGKESRGVDVLANLLRYRPGMSVDAGKYPPLFMRVFERTRERVLRRERGAVLVSSDLPGATVFVNGKSMGSTPVEVEQILPGKNHLVLRGPTGEVWGRNITVRSGNRRTVKASLVKQAAGSGLKMQEAVADNRFDSGLRRYLLQEAKKQRANYVLSMSMGRGLGVLSVGGFLGDVRRGKWVRLKSLSPDVDMLSAAIEANSLVENIYSVIRNFAPLIKGDAVGFIENKPVGGAESAAASVRYETFYDSSSLPASSVKTPEREPSPTGRTPLVANRTSGKERVERRNELTEGGRDSAVVTRDHREKSAFPTRNNRVGKPEPKERAVPLTRATAGNSSRRSDGRGPIIARTRENLDSPNLLGDSERAASRVGRSMEAPVSRDLSLDASYGTPATESWWFWTSIGATGLALAGTATWFLFFHDGEPTSVTVNAEW